MDDTLPGIAPKRRRITVDKAADLIEAAFEAGYRLGYSNGRHDEENDEPDDPTAGDGFEMWVFDTDEADARKDEAATIRALLLGGSTTDQAMGWTDEQQAEIDEFRRCAAAFAGDPYAGAAYALEVAAEACYGVGVDPNRITPNGYEQEAPHG